MKSQADSAPTLRTSLVTGGQPALATDPLPDGWTYFHSVPDPGESGQWYACAPWRVERGLTQTVVADTWPALHDAVRAEIRAYAAQEAG